MHQFGHVYALQQELLRPSSNWFRAMELWHTAREEGVALNASHYTNMLRQCVRPGAWMAALQVVRQMRRDGVRPDVTGVGCALAACTEGRKRDVVEDLFASFSRTMLLDSICYQALVRCKAEDGDSAGAVEAGKTQLRSGIALTSESLTLLLEAAAEVKELAFAEELLCYMQRCPLRLSQRGRSALCQIQQEAVSRGVSCPTLTAYLGTDESTSLISSSTTS